MITGWQPKMKVVGPVPLNFDTTVQDELVETLTTFGNKHPERVVYLGTSTSDHRPQIYQQFQAAAIDEERIHV